MSVTEADVMTLMGETQEATVGGRQAEIAAAIERQYVYQQGKAAEFGTSLGPQLLDTAVRVITTGAVGFTNALYGNSGPTPNPVRIFQQPGGEIGGPNPFPQPGERYGQPSRPGPRLPVPYEPPFQPVPALGVGAILGGIIGGLLIPDFWSIDREAGPYDTVAGGRNVIPGQGIPAPRPQGPDPEVFGPPSPEQGPDPMREAAPVEPPAPYDFGPAYDAARRAMEEQLIKDMTTPAPPPAPAPAPAQRDLPNWVWPTIGAIGAIALGRRGSRSSMTLPIAPIVDVSVEPLLSSSPTPVGAPITLSGGSGAFDSSTDNCNCHKRSSKKRRCLAKAQIGWRSGPKKGKLAGKRCYRFAND